MTVCSKAEFGVESQIKADALARLPADIRARLSDRQIERLAGLIEPPARTPHKVTYRASSSWFGTRFYIAFFLGTEKRAPERVAQDGERRRFSSVLIDIAMLSWMLFWASIVVIGLAVVAAYLLKSGLGINLFEGHFFLHDLFFD